MFPHKQTGRGASLIRPGPGADCRHRFERRLGINRRADSISGCLKASASFARSGSSAINVSSGFVAAASERLFT